jgi:hypothetical protein
MTRRRSAGRARRDHYTAVAARWAHHLVETGDVRLKNAMDVP